jgi:hypothetical protein
MTNTITTEEIALIASLKALPELPTVIARSMLVAQSVKFTREERAAIQARQDVFAKLGMPGVNVPVLNHQGGRIGELVFNA